MNINNAQLIDEITDSFAMELRRGSIILAVLSQLKEEEYGYSLIKKLNQKNFEIDQGTLYPLLRRLENQKLLESEWRLGESRPRRYYVISSLGKTILPLLHAEWSKTVQIMENVLS
jgi:DNA-binding PadR family transcriptional regulator